MSSSDTDVVVEETPPEKEKPEKPKSNHFEGIFSFLNDNNDQYSYVQKEIPEPYFINLSTISETTKKALDPDQLSAFYQRPEKYQDFIFGPLAIDAESDTFKGTFSIPDEGLSAIKSGLKAVLFCILNDSPTWPLYFSANINKHEIQKPKAHFTPLSQYYYIDVTNYLKNNNNSIQICSKSNIHGTYIFSIRLFFAPQDFDFFLQINERPHFTLNDWILFLRSNHAKEEGVESNSFLLYLVCPLSLKRLSKPVRGIKCMHLLCFDLTFYLRYTRECGKWKCPICDNDCTYDDLRIDQFVMDILNTVPENCQSVEVDEKGNVTPVSFDDNSDVEEEDL